MRTPGRWVIAIAAACSALALGCSSGRTGNGGGGGGGLTHPAGTVDSIYPLIDRPYGAAVASNGSVLVTRLDGADAPKASIADFRFLTAAAIGTVPTDVTFTPGGATAFVANQADFTVGVVNVGSLTQTSTLPLPTNVFRVKVNAAGTKLYVTNAGDSLWIFDAGTLALSKKVYVGGMANGLAFDSSGATLYVSSQSAGWVKVIQTSTDAVVGTITVGTHPQDVAISPDGTELWVADENLGTQVYGLPSGNFITTLTGTTGSFGLAITPDGAQVWTTQSGPGTMQIFGRTSRTFVKGYTAGTPRRIAFDATGAHAVVTDEQAGVVLLK